MLFGIRPNDVYNILSSLKMRQYAPSSAASQARHSVTDQNMDKRACAAVAQNVRRLLAGSVESEARHNVFNSNASGPRPDEFLYELSICREYLNTCDLPKGPTDR